MQTCGLPHEAHCCCYSAAATSLPHQAAPQQPATLPPHLNPDPPGIPTSASASALVVATLISSCRLPYHTVITHTGTAAASSHTISPGMSTSASASALFVATLMSSCRLPRTSVNAANSHSRVSVATCSSNRAGTAGSGNSCPAPYRLQCRAKRPATSHNGVFFCSRFHVQLATHCPNQLT